MSDKEVFSRYRKLYDLVGFMPNIDLVLASMCELELWEKMGPKKRRHLMRYSRSYYYRSVDKDIAVHLSKDAVKKPILYTGIDDIFLKLF